MSLGRNFILEAPDLIGDAIKAVEVPEWGGTVHVRAMSGHHRDRFEADVAKENRTKLRAKVLAWTLCDEAGNLIFTEADIDAINSKNSVVIDRLFDFAMRHNKIRKDDAEEVEKNSGAVTSASTATGSPASAG